MKKNEHIVKDIIPGSIAEELEIEPGDVLVEINGQEMEDIFDYQYYCEDYEIVLETLSSGDLSATIRQISGQEKDRLTIMQTETEDVQRYEFVWAAAGEKGDRLGRAVILDDGQYHYCLSALRDTDSETTAQIVWNEVFSSFRLD